MERKLNAEEIGYLIDKSVRVEEIRHKALYLCRSALESLIVATPALLDSPRTATIVGSTYFLIKYFGYDKTRPSRVY